MHPARPSRVRHVVLAALCLSAVLSNVQRNCLGVAEQSLRETFALDRYESGRVLSAFFLSYALFQIPAGWLGGVLGTRVGLSLFLAVSSLAMAGLGLANGLFVLVAARLVMGAAQAGTLPCCINSVAHWLPVTRRGWGSGSLGAALSIGGALRRGLTGQLLGLVSWRGTFLLYALPGLLFAAWFYSWFRDRPADHRGINDAEADLLSRNKSASSAPVGPTPWAAMAASPSTWWVCGQQFCRAAGYIFFTTWFTTYLKEARGVTLEAAGWLTSVPLLAVVVGSPLGGLLSDRLLVRTGSRRIALPGRGHRQPIFLCGLHPRRPAGGRRPPRRPAPHGRCVLLGPRWAGGLRRDH